MQQENASGNGQTRKKEEKEQQKQVEKIKWDCTYIKPGSYKAVDMYDKSIYYANCF